MSKTRDKDVLKTVALRLLPMLMVLYFMSYLDRVNVGFAALEMNADIGLSTAAYGLGAGLFFIGYFIFEVPSNLIMAKVGARIWLARIIVTWGIIAAATSLVNSEMTFYIARFMLGVAEAGFFPGLVYFLGIWFPRAQRARVLAFVYAAAPVSLLVGSPLSGFLMSQGHGLAGLPGWRFMLATEGTLTVIAGIVGFFVLVDRPSKAKWLSPEAAAALEATIAAEDADVVATHGPGTLRRAFSPRVLILSLIYCGISFGTYSIGFFLPLAVSGFQTQFGIKLDLGQIGLISAIPYVFATVALIFWGRRSDKSGERFIHFFVPAAVGGVALALAFFLNSPVAVIAGVTIAAVGIYSTIPVFWQVPAAFLTGPAAAAGIGVINSIGNLSGFVAPYVTGFLKDSTGVYSAGMLVNGSFVVLAGVTMLGLRSALRKRAGSAAVAAESTTVTPG